MGGWFRVGGAFGHGLGEKKSGRWMARLVRLGVEEGRSPWTVLVCLLTRRWEMIGQDRIGA